MLDTTDFDNGLIVIAKDDRPSKLLCCHYDLAMKYGTDPAIFINYLQFWITLNAKHHRKLACRDGRVWSFSSAQNIHNKYLRMYHPQKIKRLINKLTEEGVIMKGNYNKLGFDKTLWLAFVDEDLYLGDLNSFKAR